MICLNPLKRNRGMVPDYTTGGYELAIDSTGFKITNRGEWMRQKWRVSG